MTTQLATFGGGCFWCTEAMFSQLKGVLDVKVATVVAMLNTLATVKCAVEKRATPKSFK